MIKVHVFHTGFVRVDQAVPYHEENPLAITGLFRGKDKKMVLPVSCYLIEHPTGRILIDTGWDTLLSKKKPHRFFGLESKVSLPIIKEDEGVDTHLARLGLTSADIEAVYLSHMDVDHASGLRLVKTVKHIYASRDEIIGSQKNKIRYNASYWKGIEIEPFDYEETGIGPMRRSYDVFRDHRVLLVSTPGHSLGHMSVLIQGKEKYLILAGDVVYTQESIQKKTLPGFLVNENQARQAVDWVCQCATDKNCLGVLPNHDPSIEEQVFEIE